MPEPLPRAEPLTPAAQAQIRALQSLLLRVVVARDASPKARIPADLEISINAARAALMGTS